MTKCTNMDCKNNVCRAGLKFGRYPCTEEFCSSYTENEYRSNYSEKPKNVLFDKIESKIEILESQGLVRCTRCGGSGRHSYNPKTGSVCFKCGGVGAVEKVIK